MSRALTSAFASSNYPTAAPSPFSAALRSALLLAPADNLMYLLGVRDLGSIDEMRLQFFEAESLHVAIAVFHLLITCQPDCCAHGVGGKTPTEILTAPHQKKGKKG